MTPPARFTKKIPLSADPLQIYSAFKSVEFPSVLLESAGVSKKKGRYSFIAADPFLIMESKSGHARLRSYGNVENVDQDPFELIRRLLQRFHFESSPGDPPFLGGAIGFLGYEAKNLVETHLPQTAVDDLDLPDIYLCFFDEGVVLDHSDRTAILYSPFPQGLSRLEEKCLKGLETKNPASVLKMDASAIGAGLSAEDFMARVETAKRFIREGEIFQANLSQRFHFPVHPDEVLAIYKKLKIINPSSFFGFLDGGDFQIISGSPERLVKLENGIVETRPIAGTRARGRTGAEDAALSLELALSEKERAEHIMLVDLERNDMGRVAEYGTVAVDELMTLEDYSHVKHIVSNVRGRLRKDLDTVDVLKAFFPGGTITGTPKVRCMEIIDALEPVARGPYTGSLGYLSFSGNMDLNILIRSLVVKAKMAYLHVGAGIVIDSIPEKEYEETLCKAAGVFTAVFGEHRTRAFFEKCRPAASRA